jgi:peptidoglycan/LPS O-acetylase OafA/YrhL
MTQHSQLAAAETARPDARTVGAEIRSSQRLPELDGVRGIAILLVLFAHFSNFTRTVPLAGIDVGYYAVAPFGRYGVDLFFVLSGFLISGILLDAKTAPHHYFRNFYVRRILRIFPLYYGFLAFMIFVLPALAHLMHHADAGLTQNIHKIQWMFWCYVCNLGELFGVNINGTAIGVFWSLAVEEQFYIVWPFIVRFSSTRTLKRICVTVIIVSMLVRVGLAASGRPWWMFTFAHTDALCLGALAAILVRGPLPPLVRPRILWVGAVVCGVLGVAADPLFAGVCGPAIAETFQVGLFSLAFAALLLLAVVSPAEHWFARLLRVRVLIFFGTYSYGLYVVHSLVRAVLIRFWPPFPCNGSFLVWQVPYFCLALGISVGIAFITYHAYEKRFLNLKKRFV